MRLRNVNILYSYHQCNIELKRAVFGNRNAAPLQIVVILVVQLYTIYISLIAPHHTGISRTGKMKSVNRIRLF